MIQGVLMYLTPAPLPYGWGRGRGMGILGEFPVACGEEFHSIFIMKKMNKVTPRPVRPQI